MNQYDHNFNNIHYDQAADPRRGAHVFAHPCHRGAALVNSNSGRFPRSWSKNFQGVGPKENFIFVHDAEKTDETPGEGAHAVPPITTSQ